jgi:hypothetical protein
MSNKPNGAGAHTCDVCFRAYTWGCGHSGSQEHDARRHRGTKAHAEKRCRCYGHDHCDPKTCPLAGIRIVGYVPFYQHTPDPSGKLSIREEEEAAMDRIAEEAT